MHIYKYLVIKSFQKKSHVSDKKKIFPQKCSLQVWASCPEYQKLRPVNLIHFLLVLVTIPKSLLSTKVFMLVFCQWMPHRSKLPFLYRLSVFSQTSFPMNCCLVFVHWSLYPQLFWDIYLLLCRPLTSK